MVVEAPRTTPVFLNPRAGGADDVRTALLGDGRVELHEVAPQDLEERVRSALRAGARRVIVAGGDGSVAMAAGAIVGHSQAGGAPAELGVLPGGTLNHFAKEHGIPAALGEALDVALGPHTTRVDAARVNDHIYLNTSSVGLYVRFVDWRERLEPRLGYWIASLVAAARVILWQRPFDVMIDVSGESRRYRSSLVFIGVGERETRLPALGRRLEKGQRGLHVIVVQGAYRGRLVALAIAAAARGLHALAQKAELDTIMAERCTIEMRRRSGRVAMDGELVRMDAPLRYEILRGALTVAVPDGYLE